MTLFVLLYRLALSMLPREFRARHGEEALGMAASRVREESGARRAARAARELADLLRSAPRIRRDSARPPTRFPQKERAMRDGFIADLRSATRSLLRARGFLAVSLTTLAAGIALSTAVLVVVNAYLTRGLPYPESDRLYSIRYGDPTMAPPAGLETLDWRSLGDVFEHPISWDLDLFNLRGAPYPEAAQGTWVTEGYMAGFGVRPAMGRAFLPSDYVTGAPAVALISHRLWRTRFNGDPGVLGRQFETYVNDRPDDPQTFSVVGVLPEGLWHLNVFTEILAPLRGPSFPYMARLRDGVGPADAGERIAALVRAGGITVPDGWTIELESAHDNYVAQIRPVLVALAAATALVMLIACANVAVLFTVRATQRRREIAVRRALGASAGRITLALAAEALVVGAAATAAGLALAQVIVTLTAPLMARSLGRSAPGGVDALRLDGAAVAGALAVGIIVTLVCCAAQLWASSGAPPSLALHGGQKGASAGPQQRRAHALLIAVEVAACLTLLAGAALMVRSGLRILGVDMGLDTRDVLVGRVSLSQAAYPDAASRSAVYDRVAAGVARVEGARAVAFAGGWPLQQAPQRNVGDDAAGTLSARAGLLAVSPAYFDTLRVDITDGRAFDATDRLGGEPVTVISRALAERLWPRESVVGRRLRIGPPDNAPERPAATYVIVGVAANTRHSHTDDDLGDAYVSLRQFPSPSPFIYVRGMSASPRVEADLRQVLAGIDRDMALAIPRPLSDILDQQRAGPRFLASLLAVFSTFAAVLALLGIYGVIAYTVRQREREIAVRLAVGADRRMITWLFLRQGGVVLGAGLAMGVAGALLLGRLLQTQLFGVEAADPAAIAAVTLSFALCGLLAIGWPARAAASTDPARALRD